MHSISFHEPLKNCVKLLQVTYQSLLVLVRVLHRLDFALDVVPGLVLDPPRDRSGQVTK